MGINPTQNLPSVPIVRTGTYPDRPTYRTAVQRQSEAKPLKDSGNFTSRPVERRSHFEKGRLVDVYA